MVTQDTGRPGQRTREYSLTARSQTGRTLSSETAYIVGAGHRSGQYYIDLAARSADVTHPLAEPIEKPFLRLLLRSFRSFVNPVIDTRLGNLAVKGATKTNTIDDVSGSIIIQAFDSTVDRSWLDQADAFLSHIHRGMSFAHGGRLQTPRLDHGEGTLVRSTFFSGSASNPEFAVQHQLNHGPFIRALVDRWETKGPLPDLLWTALGWMHADTTIDEVRFLTAMTALETIVATQLPRQQRKLLDRAAFKPLHQAIKAMIDNHRNLSEETRALLAAKVGDLNRPGVRTKIRGLLGYYGIAGPDMTDETIRFLVELRNDIVHRGTIPGSLDIWKGIVLAREIVTRVLLKEIGFTGRYCCYIGGLHDRNFPV